MRCLHRNGGDRELCTDYFQYVILLPQAEEVSVALRYILTLPNARAYRDCKKQWVRPPSRFHQVSDFHRTNYLLDDGTEGSEKEGWEVHVRIET